jgi:hypothetical protein
LRNKSRLDKEQASLKGAELEIFKKRRKEIEQQFIAEYEMKELQEKREREQKKREREQREEQQWQKKREREQLEFEKELAKAKEDRYKREQELLKRLRAEVSKQRSVFDNNYKARTDIEREIAYRKMGLQGVELSIQQTKDKYSDLFFEANYQLRVAQKSYERSKVNRDLYTKEQMDAFEARRNIAQRNVEDLKKQKSLELYLLNIQAVAEAKGQIYDSIASKLHQYRTITQNAISARSSEGFSLQNRYFLNADDNFAKKTAVATQQMSKDMGDMRNRLAKIEGVLNGIKNSGISLQNVGTFSYGG